MALNRLIARYRDGRVLKGSTSDFAPGKASFHLASMDDPNMITEVLVADLKALFFVKDFFGDPNHVYRNDFDPDAPTVGKKLLVEFEDGEKMAGYTLVFNPAHGGFFLTPADSHCNTIRVFIANAAVVSVT
jgi:hypothetical protein